MQGSELRFDFGQNWESFSRLVDDERVEGARARLSSLLELPRLDGLTFLDIGCGSGLHALAALRLGARHVTAIDLDPVSVSTTRTLLAGEDPDRYRVLQADALSLDGQRLGLFDIVYSWGVLHHTGDMRRAIQEAGKRVRAGGRLALALYGRTRWCGVWKRIKRWYVQASPEERLRAEDIYIRAFAVYLRLRGKRLEDHVREYHARKRGMDFRHDVRDWLGGYPYESIRPDELRALLEPQGFELVRQKVKRRSGLFGSGNDEFLFRLKG